MTEQNPVSAAFFDLDKTIIASSSTLAFVGRFTKAGLLSRRALLKAGIAKSYYSMFGADHAQMERVRKQLSRLTVGWEKLQVEQIIAETAQEVVSPLVYAEALALIDHHLRSGRMVVLVSSGPVEIVKPLGSFLGIEHVIGTEAEVDSQDRYTGRLQFYAYGEGKVQAMQELAQIRQLSLPDSFAYTDSITDLPMLAAVGHPVAVNPDKELQTEAEQRDWQVMTFERPVTLRTRLTDMPTPVPWISGAALLAAITTGILFCVLKLRQAAKAA